MSDSISCLSFIRRMNAAQNGSALHGLTRPGQLINAHVEIEDRVFLETSTAHLTDNLSNNAGVTMRNKAVSGRPDLPDDGRVGIAKQLLLKGAQIRVLRSEHFIPFPSW